MNKDQKKIVFIIAFAAALVSIGTLTGSAINSSAICGNRVCEVGETSVSCPSDCFSICGDGICQDGDRVVCPQDCVSGEVIFAPQQVTLREGIFGS